MTITVSATIGAKSQVRSATVPYAIYMNTDAIASEYSVPEEVFHAATHGVGALLSICGLSWMLYLSIAAADPWRIVASSIYGATLVSLFLASTVYHGIEARISYSIGIPATKRQIAVV